MNDLLNLHRAQHTLRPEDNDTLLATQLHGAGQCGLHMTKQINCHLAMIVGQHGGVAIAVRRQGFSGRACGVQQAFTACRVHPVQQRRAQLLEDTLAHAEALSFWKSHVPVTGCSGVVVIVDATATEQIGRSGDHLRVERHARQLVSVAGLAGGYLGADIQATHINVLVAYTKANLRVTAGDGFKRTGRLLVTDDQLRRDVRRVDDGVTGGNCSHLKLPIKVRPARRRRRFSR